MNTRREFLFGVGAGLFLATGTLAQAPPNKTAVLTPATVVQQYLTARAAHDYVQAYGLFSAATHQQIPFAQFADGKVFPEGAAHAAQDGVSPLMEAVSVLFMDSHDTMGYTFTVLGADPADPHTVLVQARPAKALPKDIFLLKVVTSADAGAGGAPRIGMLPSYQRTSPGDMDRMREKAQAITSLSNLRQIGLGIIQYAQDHQEHLPDADRWVDQITPYLGDRTAPLAERERQIESLLHDPSVPGSQKWNYAFNRNLSGLPLSALPSPATTVLVFESTAGTKNAADTGQSLPSPGRHDGGDYYAFADGHVKWLADGAKPQFTLGPGVPSP